MDRDLDIAIFARDEARIAGYAVVWPEHILLGLLDAGGETLAVLKALRMSPVALRTAAVKQVAEQRERSQGAVSVTGAWEKPGAPAAIPPSTDHLRNVLLAARSRADELDLDVAVLLALLDSSPECMALFERYGATREKLADVVDGLMHQRGPGLKR